jgi:hypothetical protein
MGEASRNKRPFLALASHLASLGCIFTFAFHARLLVMFAPAGLCQDPLLLDLAAKTPQGRLKRLIFANFDLRHQESPPLKSKFEAHLCDKSDRLCIVWIIPLRPVDRL